jgi:hypothetical protein
MSEIRVRFNGRPARQRCEVFVRSSDVEGGTAQSEAMGVVQLAESSICATQRQIVTFVGLDIISPSHALHFVQGRATLVFTVSKYFTALPARSTYGSKMLRAKAAEPRLTNKR